MSDEKPTVTEEQADALEWAVEWAEDVFAETEPDIGTRRRLETAREALRRLRGGFTLIEVTVVLAILLCLAGIVATGAAARREVLAGEIPVTSRLWTVRHDEHLWVFGPAGDFTHHPSCPCLAGAEKE
jgi:prepilin-type N-terminal cleavage/methylation domain-containing protein